MIADVGALEEGVYNLRLRVTCESGTMFSNRISGMIDRTAPIVFDLPQPIDDVYQSGDQISASFNELLDANAPELIKST
ncbi:MAG: hypothetical protein AAF694_10925 [Bacteroidota bacterium]